MKLPSAIRFVRGPRQISNKILLLVLSLEFFSLCLWGSLTYEGSRQELINSISNKLDEAAYRTQTEIGNFLLPVKIQSAMLAEQFSENEPDLEKTRKLYYNFLRTRKEAEEIALINKNSEETLRVSRLKSYRNLPPRDLSHSDFIKKAFSESQTISTIRFSEYDEPRLEIASPIISNGNINHLITTLINLKWLWDVVEQQRIGNTGYVYLVDENLTLIAHDDPSYVLSNLFIPNTSVPSKLFQGNGSKKFSLYENFQGKQVAGVSRFDSANHWWVIVEQPVKEGLAPLTRIIHRFVIVFIIAITVTFIAVYTFSRITTRPLKTFEEGIMRVGNGERNVHIPVPEHSELAPLANSFNKMAENLDIKIQHLIESERCVRDSEEKYRKLNASLQQHISDATQKLQMSNQHLESAVICAEQANNAKSIFLANMSHELRTPLNAIIGYSEMLKEELSDNTAGSNDLSKIIDAGKHLLNIINNLLDLSKIEAGKMDIVIEEIDIAELTKDTVYTVKPLIEKNNNQLITNFSTKSGIIKSDRIKIKQTLLNLLSNAAKFTDNGTIHLTISVDKHDNILFEVKDTGIGMTGEQLKNVFSVFSQADHSIQQRFGGTGLGLVISRYYCNMLGGDISVHSVAGVGAEFTIKLPRDISGDHSVNALIKHVSTRQA